MIGLGGFLLVLTGHANELAALLHNHLLPPWLPLALSSVWLGVQSLPIIGGGVGAWRCNSFEALRVITMKALSFITLGFFAAGLSLAQTSNSGQSSHGLVIIKLSLSREKLPNQSGLPRQDEVAVPGRREDPNSDPVDKLRGSSPVPGPSSVEGKLAYSYTYSLKVKNAGEKEVRSVLWEYVAADLDSGAELNRRRFTTIEDVGRGKVATLRGTSSSPPTNVVTKGGLEKDGQSPFKSRAEIKCVLYADGTVWEAGSGEPYCAELRQADARAGKGKRP